MKKQIFEDLNYKIDPYWMVKEFFNSIYQQNKFLWALPLIVKKKDVPLMRSFVFF